MCQGSGGTQLDFKLDFLRADRLATQIAQVARALAAPDVARWVAGNAPVLDPSARHSPQLSLRSGHLTTPKFRFTRLSHAWSPLSVSPSSAACGETAISLDEESC